MSRRLSKAYEFLAKGDKARDECIEGSSKEEKKLSLKLILSRQKLNKAP